MPKIVQGIEFPDDATDQEIQEFINSESAPNIAGDEFTPESRAAYQGQLVPGSEIDSNTGAPISRYVNPGLDEPLEANPIDPFDVAALASIPFSAAKIGARAAAKSAPKATKVAAKSGGVIKRGLSRVVQKFLKRRIPGAKEVEEGKELIGDLKKIISEHAKVLKGKGKIAGKIEPRTKPVRAPKSKPGTAAYRVRKSQAMRGASKPALERRAA